MITLEIRVRGRVQGVGFRPTVYRVARALGLAGHVSNDAEGVLIVASGDAAAMTSFLARLTSDAPPLARVEAVETRPLALAVEGGFRIVESRSGAARTEVAPDAAVCAACSAEVLSPAERRFGYPFATCTHCGPRLSIVRGIPYDRAATSMASFALCAPCRAEYDAATDRRFHAEAIACPACGPRARLVRLGRLHEGDADPTEVPIDAAFDRIARGDIVAIKGLGGYQLACDAANPEAVARLRERKLRDAKPFALMARDLDVVRRYARVSGEEAALLSSAEAPIVLLDSGGEALPEAIAPGHRTLGFLLPTTPLHVLLLRRAAGPIVMTSGNVAGAPPIVDDAVARTVLASIADWMLVHDRAIEHRVDDSVARVVGGTPRLLRRARGYAPSPIRLPAGFECAPPLVAYGAELKGTFCVLADGEAVVSQHQGDLDDVETLAGFTKSLALYEAMFAAAPRAIVADLHPGYASTRLAVARAAEASLPVVRVQHHHAHVAACLAENGRALDAPPVLGVALDGVGLGDDGALWGGEFLIADYRVATRVATFAPAALLGGDQAAREPWRNLYAHLVGALGWAEIERDFGAIDVVRRLRDRPRAVLDRMMAGGLHAPLASSCGRLFDAVAAATGVAFERQAYEGQAGALLEAIADGDEPIAYPFAIAVGAPGLPRLDAGPMWRALLADLARGTAAGVVSARFHRGLARGVCATVTELRRQNEFSVVALSGGCFQNRLLFEETARGLAEAGFEVLSHGRVPSNDGGISLGQAAVGAARVLSGRVEVWDSGGMGEDAGEG